MAEHLFLISIGPVQEFIAAARRTRDLWAGSQLLSHLSRTAAQELREIHGATLIFPAQENLDAHDVVNRIVAKLPDGVDPRNVGSDVEQAVREALAELYRLVFNDTDRIRWPKDTGYRMRAEAQVADLIEIAWAAAPISDTFQASRRNLEAALAARKNTRVFTQPAWGLPVPKSSIDGLRESVIDESEYDDGHDPAPFRSKVARLFALYGAGRAERLSGVDLFKRHYQPNPAEGYADFPSTSHFAALPLLWRTHVAKKDIRYGLSRYLDVLRAAYDAQESERRLHMLRLNKRFETPVSLYNYDASILFASRLEEELADVSLKQAQDALATYLRESLGAEPEPYYAILLADGDSMGRVIDNQKDLDSQRQLSLALDTFADGVRSIVESPDHRGALVYAGGDDVLAFLPLDTALACAEKLHEEYTNQMHGFRAKQDYPSTLSVGIVICHHLEPLTDALNLARKAEKFAKKRPGKDGLAIILSKRGGGDRIIAGGWGGPFYKRLTDLITLHQHEAIPDGAAFDLNDLALRVGRTLPPKALKAEALRIVTRKRGQRGGDDLPNTSLLDLAAGLPETEVPTGGRGITEFADELIVAREFARALGLVAPEKKEVPA